MSDYTTTKELGVLMRTKVDIEFILRWDYDAYLCEAKYMTIYHFRDLLSGDKKVRKTQFDLHSPFFVAKNLIPTRTLILQLLFFIGFEN